MRSALLFGALQLAKLAASQSWAIDPPTDAPADTILDCTNWHVGAAGDSCEAIAAAAVISLSELYRYNPSLANGCKIKEGISYCVEQNFGAPPDVTSTSSTSTRSSTTAIPTPKPTQPGLGAGCTDFDFVEEDDSCSSITARNNLSIGQLFALNPGIKEDCSGLWLKVYICVGGPAASMTVSTIKVTSTTSSGFPTGTNGIPTPSPTQPPSIVSNCNKFYFAKTGTDCNQVLSQNGITLAQLFAWNSGVKNDCSGMWSNVYLCVGVIGGGDQSTLKATTTTQPAFSTGSNGIPTPLPTQPPSIVSNCNKFWFAKEGKDCADACVDNGISQAQLFAWNSGVKSDCSGMWTNVYLCIGVIGGVGESATQKTTTKTTSSTFSTGSNGIPTPLPTQPPSIVSNCNKFYFIKLGTTCNQVLSENGISFAQLLAWNSGIKSDCSGLWAEVNLCVGVVGGTTTTTTRTTTTRTTSTSTSTRGNGVTTPTPTQPGMVTNCKSFYKVIDGDDCPKVASKNKISVDNLKKWNTQLGASCTIWLGYQLCVAVL